MNLMSKINIYLDYNNHATLNKAMRTLKREFEIAKKTSHPQYAQEVIRVTKHIHDTLTGAYQDTSGYQETMSWHQKVIARNIRKLINWMEKNQRFVRPLLSEIPDGD